ncbi:sodium/calcium exchanger NCL1-like [Aristolochia californica]|uniref:sodium/calcium exchanger NCL1-like n=1 Tax=Aristolochia californica TaxID=171875 RepID=UPI0035D8F858
MTRAAKPFFLLWALLFLLAGIAHSRLVADPTSDLFSSGLRDVQQPSLLRLRRQVSAPEKCEQTYGFLPCTDTVMGNLFLVLVYGYLMFLAATYLSTGSELLLDILGPGIVGGLFLPILGALPDAILILVSGLSGSRETAQHQVLIGMGLLAGSTVMLLTVLWGSCVVLGKVDLSEDSTSTGFSLTEYGVTTDVQTSHAAKIMVISITPFIIVQAPKIFRLSSGNRVVILISLIVSFAFLLSYCLFQIFQPWVQRRRLEFAQQKHVMAGFLKHLERGALGPLLTSDDEPNIPLIEKLFDKMDSNSDNVISQSELRAVIIGMLMELDVNPDDVVNRMMVEFDKSCDELIDKSEFVSGIVELINKAKQVVVNKDELTSGYHEITKAEHDMLLDKDDGTAENVGNPTWVTIKAVLMLLLGTAIAAAFADPLVNAVDNFSDATSIPSFFISFIAMPLATNSSEAVSALIFASRKTKKSASLTFSEIYGAVTMNNTLCLGVFLALVSVRNLSWDFSAEVLVIFVVSIVMGLFASFRTKFPLWTCSVAYVLYPFSLLLVYVLDFVYGWS